VTTGFFAAVMMRQQSRLLLRKSSVLSISKTSTNFVHLVWP